MDWQLVLLLIFGMLIVLMVLGLPVAFCFLLVNLVWLFIFSGPTGWEQLISRMFNSLNTFTMIPLCLFILMGDFMFTSGVAPILVRTLDKWLGKVPGRLSLLAVGAGTLLAALTGTALASVAILGSSLVPQMEQAGYKKPLTIGPILASAGLAMLIPPSALAVLGATISEVSVAETLLAIIMPGIMIAIILVFYIVLRSILQPQLAPVYNVPPSSLSTKLKDTAKYVLPQGIVIFLVIGVMIIGVATPSEAAATGCFGTFILAAVYGLMNWKIFKKSVTSTTKMVGMIFLIITGAQAFSQILAFSGASKGMAEFITTLPVEPILIIIAMQVVVLILGCFMEVISIMMITLPIFIPLVAPLGFNPVWFLAIFLVNIATASNTPPFGLSLFIMKGVMSKDTTMGDIYRAAIPMCVLYIIAMGIMLAFPQITLWLPGVSKG